MKVSLQVQELMQSPKQVKSLMRVRTIPEPSALAYVASIQSQYEQSPRYKYSDPAVVLMSKVYQTTDSIHVETATLPGNSSTNRD